MQHPTSSPYAMVATLGMHGAMVGFWFWFDQTIETKTRAARNLSTAVPFLFSFYSMAADISSHFRGERSEL
jgi:hypothetical protein